MTNHPRHLTNLDREELPLYQGAIDQLGVDVSIWPGAFDCLGRMWNAERYSLWAPRVPVDLSKFWRLVEA